MESKVADLLGCKLRPIVAIKSENRIEGAIGPKAGGAHCVMAFIARVIVDRKLAVFEKDTVNCVGGRSGLGFGNAYAVDEKTLNNYSAFLSTGLKEAEDIESYNEFLMEKPEQARPMFEGGERVYSSYKQAKEFLSSKVPIYENEDYLVFKPLEDLADDEIPDSVIFTVNTFELAALLNFDASLRDDFGFVMTPPAAACQAMASFVFREAEKEDPHPVLGLLDFAGRSHMKKWVGDDYLNVSVPWKLFLKYEENCEYSYLDGHVWKMNRKD